MRAVTRSQAIELLRQKCLGLLDDDHSLCQVASRIHVLCGGFSRWSSAELRRRLHGIVEKRPSITRTELERLADRWQLACQSRRDGRLPCDAPNLLCDGWDGFSNADLGRFCKDLTGEALAVVPDPTASVDGEDPGSGEEPGPPR